MMQIMYRGRPFILEDIGESYRLTSVETKNGRQIILEFIKSEEQSIKAVQAFAQMLRKAIITNHFKGVS